MGDPLIGQTIGQVRLLSRLGAGAMGVVYKGFHGAFARDVAVKLLTSTSANARERFLREGRAAARVDHRQVVKIIDAGEYHGRGYLVLEFVDGKSLGDLLDTQAEQDRSLPPLDGRPVGSLAQAATVIGLARQIAQGLAAIHAAGIIHRDIKPDNIMVAKDGTAKVADLGLAKAIEEPEALRLTGSGMVVGTPLYVAPEAIRDPQSVTPAADLYSLGATLYHLLTGRPPFVCPTAYEVMRAHLEEAPVPLHQLRPGLPARLVRLVERCLEKKPERRPTAAELALALEDVGDGVGRGLGGLAVVAAVVALVTGGTLMGTWWLLRPRAAEAVVLPPVPVRLLVNHPRAEVRVDGGAWRGIGDGVLPLPAGRRLVEVRVDQGGPLLAWSGTLDLDPAALPAPVPVTLGGSPVPSVRHALAGTGLAFVDGVAVGRDAQVSLSWVGTFHLGRWDGTLWRSQTVTVDRDGALKAGDVVNAERPDGPAWWRTVDDRAQPLPPHHRVTWGQIEAARTARKLIAPPGWQLQQLRDHEPAGALPLSLVGPLVEELSRTGGRLPDADAARTLAEAYGFGVWAGGSAPAVVGSPVRSAARIILVP